MHSYCTTTASWFIMTNKSLNILPLNIRKIMTLLPGDVIATGTPSGIGPLKKGDIVKIEIELWNGYCYVHDQVSKEDVIFYRERFPKCTIAVHPECKKEVRNLADFVGSTSQIVKFVKQTTSDIIVVGTEEGIIHYLKKIAPNKVFYSLHRRFICDAMKLITLPRLYNCLKNEMYEIRLDEKLLEEARKPIEKMLKLS
ncbi:MAG TPA: hypothetical protein EYP03_04640 [Aquificae bacterium]|nr:hypothetical protein [Aquificota bacterium]